MRNLLLVAAVVMMSVGCSSFKENLQFGDNNFGRTKLGGSARWGFSDLLASDSDEKHGDHYSGMSGDLKVGTVVYEDDNVQADLAVGPEIGGMIGDGDKSGTRYTGAVDARVYCKAFENLGEWAEGLNPFVSGSFGLGYADVDPGTSDKGIMTMGVGAGVRYEFDESWSASAEYQLNHLTGLGDNFFDHGHTSHGTSADTIFVGVQYRF